MSVVICYHRPPLCCTCCCCWWWWWRWWQWRAWLTIAADRQASGHVELLVRMQRHFSTT